MDDERTVAAADGRPPPRTSGLLFGLGLGGFVDGIVLHQILQWHHMVSAEAPSNTVAGLELNTLADGFFHLATWILVVARACVLSPLGEELLFRGALFGWLRARLSAWPTIAITALAFAAIHGLAPTMVPLALIVGVAAGYARERFGAVTPLLIVHVVQNVLVELAGLWSMR